METILLIYSVIVGLLIGSFLNVVAIRIPKRESISFPPSHCMHCEHRLGPLDLVPVFSYVLLRGQCRYCKEQISPVYSIGEAVTALAFACTALVLGWRPELAVGLLFSAILLAVSQTDLRYMLIPDRIVVFGLALGAVLRLWSHPLPLWNYAAAFLLGGGLYYLIALVSRGGMGGGDIKLFAFVGLILGIRLTLLTVFLSSLLGFVYGLILIAIGRYSRSKGIPLGPFIALAAWFSFLWGERLLAWYLEMFH